MKMNKLLPELNSNWGANVRTILSRSEWDAIRKLSYDQAGYVCEICGENGLKQGFRHPVECHEVWEWDVENKTQTLKRMISLCPRCHRTKHFGFHGEDEAIDQLMKVNEISQKEAEKIIQECLEDHESKLGIEWTIDLTAIGHGVLKPEDYKITKNIDDFKRRTTMHYKLPADYRLKGYQKQTRSRLEEIAKITFGEENINDPRVLNEILKAEKRRDQQIKSLTPTI